MASAWGDSWGPYWGDSWGSVAVEERQPSAAPLDELQLLLEREEEEILAVICAFLQLKS